jgi:hypothetical protein
MYICVICDTVPVAIDHVFTMSHVIHTAIVMRGKIILNAVY